MNNILRRTRRTESGIAATEFALTLPLLVILFLGMADMTNKLVLAERVDRVSYTVTDLVSQSQTLKTTDLDTMLLAAGELMDPYPFGASGIVIISSVYKASGNSAKVMWQYSGGGTLARTSKIGTTGGTAALPNGLTLNDNENIIMSEVYYAYKPMFTGAGIFSAEDMYHVSFFKPRLNALIKTPT